MGQATGHTRQHFQNYLDKNNLTFADIETNEDDVTHAFNKGALLEKARKTLSDYGFGKLTREQLDQAFSEFNRNSMEIDIVEAIELDDCRMSMYEKRHEEAVSDGPT